MTSVLSGREDLVFHSKADVAAHLLHSVLKNNNKWMGTEWEFFFIDELGDPITRVNGKRAFEEFKSVFALMGYTSDYLTETQATGETTIVGLSIDDLGNIVPEAGYQFEFASIVCKTPEDLSDCHATAYRAINEVAARINHRAVFKGFLEDYAQKTEGISRSRGLQWGRYYQNRFGGDCDDLRDAQFATCSTQITLDSGGEYFYEYYKALLLIEPLLSLHYANSQRSYVGVRAYSKKIPSQVLPILDAWTAQSSEETIRVIVERLMNIEVPFLPDPEQPGLYKLEPLINGTPPKVGDLMAAGRLDEKSLNNIGGFFYMRPAFRNFTHALIEVRGTDSLPNAAIVDEFAELVTALIYHDKTRQGLLADYAHWDKLDIQALHDAANARNWSLAKARHIKGQTVTEIINDVLGRAMPSTEEIYEISRSA